LNGPLCLFAEAKFGQKSLLFLTHFCIVQLSSLLYNIYIMMSSNMKPIDNIIVYYTVFELEEEKNDVIYKVLVYNFNVLKIKIQTSGYDVV
jgi:hypothetical protein